jgi:arsenic resistance protein ArsH
METALTDTPQLSEEHLHVPDTDRLFPVGHESHPPKILLLYGSLRKRSFSRLMTEEAARVLHRLGAETRTFNPSGLPLPDDAEADHPKVQELRDLVPGARGWSGARPNAMVQ